MSGLNLDNVLGNMVKAGYRRTCYGLPDIWEICNRLIILKTWALTGEIKAF